jgi:nucleotide-binding universal stress UspA family protein
MTVVVAVQNHAESVLRDAALDALGPEAAPAELRVVQGVPGRSLVDAARTLGAELLVAGSRGEKAMSWLLGSQYVLRNAPCPVLLVPETG